MFREEIRNENSRMEIKQTIRFIKSVTFLTHTEDFRKTKTDHRLILCTEQNNQLKTTKTKQIMFSLPGLTDTAAFVIAESSCTDPNVLFAAKCAAGCCGGLGLAAGQLKRLPTGRVREDGGGGTGDRTGGKGRVVVVVEVTACVAPPSASELVAPGESERKVEGGGRGREGWW